MTKRAKRNRAVDRITIPVTPWDMGAAGPANRANLTVEDAAEIDPETGKVVNPNGGVAVKNTPPAKLLKRALDYNPETGDLIWKTADASRFSDGPVVSADGKAQGFNYRYAGKQFGAVSKSGYRCGAVSGRHFKAHRLIFKMMTGREPVGVIDHINGIKDDNRWSNLREVSPGDNSRNQTIRSNNVTGVMGVSWYVPTGKWRAAISVNGKKQHVGYFDDFSDAVAARRAAEIKLGYHENHGREKDVLSELGLTTELSRMDMVAEDVVYFDEKKGEYVKGPNGLKRARRVDMLGVWHRKGVITTAGYNAAERLRDAYEATQRAPGWADNDRVQSSPKPDHAVTIQIDRLSAFARIMARVENGDRAIVWHCILEGHAPTTAVINGHKPYYGDNAGGLAHVRDALDRLARNMGS